MNALKSSVKPQVRSNWFTIISFSFELECISQREETAAITISVAVIIFLLVCILFILRDKYSDKVKSINFAKLTSIKSNYFLLIECSVIDQVVFRGYVHVLTLFLLVLLFFSHELINKNV